MAHDEEFETFSRDFGSATVPVPILHAVFRKFKDWSPSPTHQVHGRDDITDVYGMVDEDFDDAVRELLSDCKCRIPSSAEAKASPRLHTVADLVTFLSSFA